MKYINSLKENEALVTYYLCKDKHLLTSKTGKNYIALKLQDKTGTIEGKIWDINNDVQSFEANDIVKIDATVNSYQNELQLHIKKLRKARPNEYSMSDYIPVSERDLEEMRNELKSIIESIDNTYLKRLLEEIFLNDEKISEQFIYHSAAKSMHHNYLSGLMEHTLSVTELCIYISKKYKNINRDLLLTSALLHDIGKIYELSSFPENEYTDEGQLLGHIYMGAELIALKAAQIEDFPRDLENLLKHLILSHHGEYEYGSPELPKIIEGWALYAADNLDAKLTNFDDLLTKEAGKSNMWLGYNKMLQRNLRRTEF